MKVYLLLLVLASLLLVTAQAGCNGGTTPPPGDDGDTDGDGIDGGTDGADGNGGTTATIEMTASGFSPSTLTITAGTTVTFVNSDTKERWPASAVHPTHRVYPESGGCLGSKFDACRGLAPGESWSFTFNQKGTWRYHDHLTTSLTGTVIVV